MRHKNNNGMLIVILILSYLKKPLTIKARGMINIVKWFLGASVSTPLGQLDKR